MALFGPKDKDLPLLTQAFQLNVDNPDEVARFITMHDKIWRTPPQDREQRHDPPVAATMKQAAATIEAVNTETTISAVNLAVVIMYSAVDRDGVDGVWMKALNKALLWTSDHNTVGYYPFNPAFVPLDAMFRLEKEDDLLPRRILLAVRDALLHMIEDRTFLRRCTECSSIFECSRTGQIFCSHRCADRAGQKRRRRLNKADLQEQHRDSAPAVQPRRRERRSGRAAEQTTILSY
jgi:hypothetical protein